MKKYIIPLFLLFLLSGCAVKPVENKITTLSYNNQVSSDATPKESGEPDTNKSNLTTLNIVLPTNWHVDTNDKFQYNIVDDNGKNRGWVISRKYEAEFDFSNIKPNHSSIINDEYIDIPLGKCRLITLDADNGTAASGITGTHNDYYAITSLEDKIIYILEFTQNDKKPQTKEQFIEILKNLNSK